MKLKEILGCLVIVFGLLGGIYAAIHAFPTTEDVIKMEESLKAKDIKQDEQIKLVGESLNRKILNDRLKALEESIIYS